MHLPLPPSSIMDKDLSAFSPSQVGSRIQNDVPKSAIHTSSSSSSSSPTSSCVYVQSLDDEHFSPKNATPKLGKPALSGITPSKSDTESNRVESMKFHNESFGPLTPNRRDSDKNKARPGMVNRSSRFSERLQVGSKTSKASEVDSRELRSKLRLSIQADIEKEPIPVTTTSMKVDELSPNSKSGFFKKRAAMVLTPGQLDMINDKVVKNTGHLKRQRSLSVNVEKVSKVGRSKLLQRISNIAARGSIVGVGAGEPAVIFKQLLKKVNPESLHKAEKDLKRRYIRKIFEFFKTAVKVPFEILTPDDFFTIFWNFFILTFVIYDSFIKPFEVCFYVDNRRDHYMLISVIISCIIFTIDIIFNFRTAFYNKGVLVTSGSAIVKQYLNTNFKWDILVLSCDYVSLASTLDGLWHLKLMSVIRFNKLLDLMLRTEDFLNLSRPAQATLKMVKLWGTILLVAHWIACFFHLIAYMQMDSEVTWLHVNGLINASVNERYVAAIYWSILTMTTVGYGDVAPVSTYERIYAILAMIIASAVFGYSMNTVANIVKEISFEKDDRREKISNVKIYMNQKSLGKNIQTRVKNYIQYIIDSKRIHKNSEEKQVMDHLSQNLKDEIVSEVNGKILANCKMFSVNFSNKAALNLAKFMKETFHAPEDIIFNEGERTDCAIFFIGYGKIELYHRVRNFDVLEKGSQFGEIAFFSGQPRFASAKSLFFSNLYSLARDTALENINIVPSDFEMFHFIKDKINIDKDFSQLDISCFSCHRKGHMARDCDQIHYVPNNKEIIEKFITRIKNFRKHFRRHTRARMNPLTNIRRMEEAAKMIQEDYSDYTISDEELSQDSIDVILEKNLIILPAAEMNDMKARKVERRNKSQRYSAQAIVGEFVAASGSVIPRFSHASQNVTRDDGMEPRPSTKMTPSEIAFFTIDKVENFEVYYPHFNIKTMIQKFEKIRLNAMLRGNQGGAKAIVLKNFGSLLRDRNRRGTAQKGPASPVYFTKPSFEKKNTLQRRRKTLSKDQHVPETSLKTQMHRAITKAKSIRRLLLNKTFDEDTIENHFSTPTGSYGGSPGLAVDQNESLKKSSQDEATVPRKDTWDDKKASKNKAQVFNFEPLSQQHTMTKLKLEHLDTNALPSSVRALGTIESPGASQSKYARKSHTIQSSKKGTIIQHMLTKNSLDDRVSIFNIGHIKNEEIEHALMHAMVKEEYGVAGGAKPSKKALKGRSYSLERLDDIKKAITKYKMPKIIKGLMESAAPPKTANFG